MGGSKTIQQVRIPPGADAKNHQVRQGDLDGLVTALLAFRSFGQSWYTCNTSSEARDKALSITSNSDRSFGPHSPQGDRHAQHRRRQRICH